MPFAAICTNGGNAQLATFAKFGRRPFADIALKLLCCARQAKAAVRTIFQYTWIDTAPESTYELVNDANFAINTRTANARITAVACQKATGFRWAIGTCALGITFLFGMRKSAVNSDKDS